MFENIQVKDSVSIVDTKKDVTYPARVTKVTENFFYVPSIYGKAFDDVPYLKDTGYHGGGDNPRYKILPSEEVYWDGFYKGVKKSEIGTLMEKASMETLENVLKLLQKEVN